MIDIIHKILVLPKNHINYLKDNIKITFDKYIRLFLKKIFITYND